MENRDPVQSAFAAAIQFTRLTERLYSALGLVSKTATDLGELLEIDPELSPEIFAASSSLLEAAEALSRAHTFVDARLSALVESLSNEGGTPA